MKPVALVMLKSCGVMSVVLYGEENQRTVFFLNLKLESVMNVTSVLHSVASVDA